jgi:uncharacterized membrane protein YkvA (DUF1232 family)
VALLFFLRRLFSVVYLMSHPAVPLWLKALPVLAVVYLIFPRDLVPDFFRFPFGIFDDLFVVGLLLGIFINKGWDYVDRDGKRKDDSIDTDFQVLGRDGPASNGRRAYEDPAKAPEDDRPPRSDLRSR